MHFYCKLITNGEFTNILKWSNPKETMVFRRIVFSNLRLNYNNVLVSS